MPVGEHDRMSFLEQGDIIEVDFNSPVGHELAKMRPAIVVTDYAFNCRSSMAGVVPLQSKDSSYPLHVAVTSEGAHGFACIELARTIDVDCRGFRIVGAASAKTMEHILEILKGMYGFA